MLKVTAFLTSSENYNRRQLKSRCVQSHEQEAVLLTTDRAQETWGLCRRELKNSAKAFIHCSWPDLGLCEVIGIVPLWVPLDSHRRTRTWQESEDCSHNNSIIPLYDSSCTPLAEKDRQNPRVPERQMSGHN